VYRNKRGIPTWEANPHGLVVPKIEKETCLATIMTMTVPLSKSISHIPRSLDVDVHAPGTILRPATALAARALPDNLAGMGITRTSENHCMQSVHPALLLDAIGHEFSMAPDACWGNMFGEKKS